MPEDKEAPDLLDLKFLPAWLKEAPNENAYSDYAGEEGEPTRTREGRGQERRGGDRRGRGPRPPRGKEEGQQSRGRERRPGMQRPPEARLREAPAGPMPLVKVRFTPDSRVLESVLAQIKAGHLAYSVFSLARMFLDKPERYDVHLKAETAVLFQLDENGPVASDRRVLENAAFLSEKHRFYRSEITQSEPIKGNFTSVARCRLSGVFLGPTNHHAYQSQLRNLYEQRFSRRMSFPDYQRQIEIVSSPEAVERWKEETRSVTTYVTLQEETPLTFNSAAETERHFRQTYLPGLVHSGTELKIDGIVSRRLLDRSLGRLIEDAWAQEFRSPARMMQELSGAFRQGPLQIFRHRKGMLFVSPIRTRPFSHASSSLSISVAGVLAALNERPGMNRKQLLEKLHPEEAGETEERERTKMALASDLHWLISEGYVIEFNDGSLDLPRTKAPAPSAPPSGDADTSNGSQAPASLPNESGKAALPVASEPASAETQAVGPEPLPELAAQESQTQNPAQGESERPASIPVLREAEAASPPNPGTSAES
ncbi:MAG: hypothetical protein ACREIF_08785 [Chthoniobacterales bacterium]